MKRNFVQVAQFLKQQAQYPDQLRIEGGVYPAPPVVEFLTKIMSYLQLAGLAWMVVGLPALCRLVGYTRPPPAWTRTVEANAMPLGALLFLIAPQFLAAYQTTGAFELMVADGSNADGSSPSHALMFSKLEAGRFPTQEELLQGMQAVGIELRSS
jgi:selT/selW/selH-like putative selenoprotein